MSSQLIDYSDLQMRAMRTIPRQALAQVAESGLPGNHHFYITFRTGHPGVRIAGSLLAQYPDEMTIVLQHVFSGLEVDEDGFDVTLSFSGRSEPLRIPFDALVKFVDPAAEFGIQFGAAAEGDDGGGAGTAPAAENPTDHGADSGESPPPERPRTTGDVVALDAFRKKNG